MADIGFVRSQLAGIADEKTRRILVTVFEHVLGNLRFGEVVHHDRAVNFQSYFQEGTTSSTAATEFSIEHGMEQIPHLAIPVLDLQAAGAQIVPLTVSKVADGKRVYLRTTSTHTPIALLVE